MSLPQIVAYVWLGQALLGLLPWNVDAELQEKMMSGAVAYELLRPVDLYAFWYARTVALRTATTFLRMIPMIVFAGFRAAADRPRHVGVAAAGECGRRGVCFVVSITATVALASAVTMLMHVALIWTLSGRGFNTLMTGIVIVLSGLIVPLPLFPDWLQPFLYWQPFSRARRRAVPHLRRQHRTRRGRARDRATVRVDGVDRRPVGYSVDGAREDRASSCRADEMIDALRLYGRMIGVSIRRRCEHRVSFLLMSLGHFVTTGVEMFWHLGVVRPVRQPVAVDAAAGRVLLRRRQHQFRVHRCVGARLRSVRRAVHQNRQFRSRCCGRAAPCCNSPVTSSRCFASAVCCRA